MYTHILVATDGSKLSQTAVKSAIGLALACGAKLSAVKVVPRFAQTYFEGSMPLSSAEVKRIEDQWAKDAQLVLAAIVKTGLSKGLAVKAVVAKGDDVAQTLLATAQKNKADLLVMASHGRSGIKRLLLGSETLQVLTHSKLPVLVLR